MNYPDRAEGVELVTDYPPVRVQQSLAKRAAGRYVEEIEVHLDIIGELLTSVKRIIDREVT